MEGKSSWQHYSHSLSELVFGRKAVVVVGEQWEMKIKRVIMRALAL
jgi:hypothetical protein